MSLLDKLIYRIFEVIFGFALPLAVLVILGFYIPDKIAFRDESVLLSYNRLGIVTALLLMFVILMIVIVPLDYGLRNRIPLFGNKRFKPERFERVIPTYSLFSKDFSKNLLPGFNKKLKIYIRVSIIALAVALLIYPLGLCSRITFDTSDSIKFYNVFNVCTDEYHWSDVSELEIDIVNAGRSVRKRIEIYYTLDGKSRTLVRGISSKFKTTEEELLYYLHIKEYFDEGEYTVYSEDMDMFLSTNDCTPSEIQLIYELFDYTP